MHRSICRCVYLLSALLLADGMTLAADREDIVIADFEATTYGDWKAEGEAFGPGPARGTLANQMQVSGYRGERLVNSYFQGDGTQGTLTSPEFKVTRKRLNFLVGGGHQPDATRIELLLKDKVVRAATGHDSEHLTWQSWDVSDLADQTVRVRIVDRHTAGWGHINADQIVLSDEAPKESDSRDEAIERATASVAAAAKRAATDPLRPVYHFLAPGNWMNDPNGPIQFGGFYHMFYQHNPYGDEWGNMHWGHARSKDLVHWEHLPIALWPSKEKGEDHAFSGSAVLDASGKPMIFYTAIGPRMNAGDSAQQWAALPEDDELIRWKKHPGNPIVPEKLHGDVKILDWRDPFVFREGDLWYMVVGGHRKGGKGCIALYSSDDLEEWKFLGIPIEGTEDNWECPNLFKLGGRWVLVYSPHAAVRYYVGQLDLKNCKFTPEHHGILDHSDNYYAPNCLLDDQNRRIMWGWVRGFPAGRSWNGSLSLPRVLTLAEDNHLIQQPARELQMLRGAVHELENVRVTSTARRLEGVQGDTLELVAEINPADAKQAGLRFGGRAQQSPWTIEYDGEQLTVAGRKAPLKLAAGENLSLHVFIDGAVVEVYADHGRVCMTRVLEVTGGDDQTTEFFSTGGSASLTSMKAWKMKSIWPKQSSE